MISLADELRGIKPSKRKGEPVINLPDDAPRTCIRPAIRERKYINIAKFQAMRAQGLSNLEIACKTRFNPKTVYRYLREADAQSR